MNAEFITKRDSFKDSVDHYAFGSPIEEEFYRVISKYLSPDCELINQYPITAGRYKFRADFVVMLGKEKIGFECDGKDFHNPDKDLWRDTLIIDSDQLLSVIRLRGTDIVFRLQDALYVTAVWHPELFSGRGLEHIQFLATPTAKESPIYKGEARFRYRLDHECAEDEFSDGFGEMVVTRHWKRKGPK